MPYKTQPIRVQKSGPQNLYYNTNARSLQREHPALQLTKERRFWAADVNRKFMFLLLARFHARPMSYKALILAFTKWLFEWKGWNTHQRGAISTSGWRPWLKNVKLPSLFQALGSWSLEQAILGNMRNMKRMRAPRVHLSAALFNRGKTMLLAHAFLSAELIKGLGASRNGPLVSAWWKINNDDGVVYR